MFCGIVEEFATVVAIKKDRENIDFTLTCSFTSELKIDQSVAHNGVCLTVVAIEGNNYVVTAMKETLDRTNLGLLKKISVMEDSMPRMKKSMKPRRLPTPMTSSPDYLKDLTPC